ncbi:hypothetical protein FRC01_014604, partial [Tulasnella sp. 417]
MACDLLSFYPGIGDRLLSLTVEAVHTCQNQPSERNSSIAEQFATAFYHIMLCYPRNHELWNELCRRLPVGSYRARYGTILPMLENVLLRTNDTFFRDKHSYTFRKVILHSMIVNFHAQWAFTGRTILMSSYDDAILSLLALQISLRIGKYADSMEIRIGDKLRTLVLRAYMGADLERNIADALPALVSSIVSETSDQIEDKLNVAFICVAFLQRIKVSLVRGVPSPLLRETISSCLPTLLGGFGTLKNRELEGARLATVALSSVYNTIQYAVVAAEKGHKYTGYGYLDDYLLGYLQWTSLYGPPELRSGLEKYPRIVAWIASKLKDSPDSKRDTWLRIIHTRLNWVVHRRNLTVWEDAELGTQAVRCLRKATANDHVTCAVDIIRLLISLSVDCSAELVAAEIVQAITEVPEAITGWPQWMQTLRPSIYMNLLDLILK